VAGFALLAAMTQSLPLESLAESLPIVFQLLCQRLATLKTNKFVREFVVTTSTFVCLHGADTVLELFNGVQPNCWVALLEQFWLPGLALVKGTESRKSCVVALTKFACESVALSDPSQQPLWNKIVASTVALLESGSGDVTEGDDFGLEEMSGHTAFSRLTNVAKLQHDPIPHIVDACQYFATSMSTFSQASPGLGDKLTAALEPAHLAVVQQYFASYGVGLS
jgi:hypothetical protein